MSSGAGSEFDRDQDPASDLPVAAMVVTALGLMLFAVLLDRQSEVASPRREDAPSQPTPTFPVEERSALEASSGSPDGTLLSWACTAVVVMLLLSGLQVIYRVFEPHFLEGSARTPQVSEHLYMLSAVVGAAGALLQGGILVLAPILSLSLHHSYDALFELLRSTADSPVSRHRRLHSRCLRQLRTYRRVYKILNPLYYGIWIFTCLFMAIAGIRLIVQPWMASNIFYEALAFFVASLLLSVVFALVSVVYFIWIKPGVTKLDYYTALFTIEEEIP